MRMERLSSRGTRLMAHPLSLLAALVLLTGQASTPTDRSVGTWRNPSDTVRVRSRPCGAAMCGTVIWASDKAKADAARGGTPNLIGMDLFKNFKRDAKGVWHGRVFVPDINKTFSGTITVIDRNTVKGSGCLIGRIGCKSQVWTRVPE
jgi:uncharacterized protein (DUF2147 family)